MAGSIDPAFNGFADPWLMDWKPLNRYFAKFVAAKDYVVAYHLPVSGGFGGDAEMTDRIDKNKRFDVIHFMASLDAGYRYTGLYLGNTGTIPNLDLTGDFKHIASWAGDLQSAARDYDATNEVIGDHSSSATPALSRDYDATNEVIGDPLSYLKKGAQEQDLLADIDAINVASEYLTGTGYVSDALRNYYDATQSMNKRCWDFVKNVAGSYSVYNFETKVYSYLGLTRSGSEWVDAPISSLINEPKYWILNGGKTENTPEIDYRKKLPGPSATMSNPSLP